MIDRGQMYPAIKNRDRNQQKQHVFFSSDVSQAPPFYAPVNQIMWKIINRSCYLASKQSINHNQQQYD